MSLKSKFVERLFPGLIHTSYERHSCPTQSYNCIAYAAGDLFMWWDNFAGYWPPNAERGPLLSDLAAAFQCEGFENCGQNGSPEEGYEKVALYQNANGEWTHAARLRPDGWWESKLGKEHDILHERPADVEGVGYGTAACYMKRTMRASLRARIIARQRAKANHRW